MKLKLGQRGTAQDIQCVILARLGFSYKLIQKETKLSKRQITLRIRQTQSYLRDYRNGNSIVSKKIIDNSANIQKELINEISRRLKG